MTDPQGFVHVVSVDDAVSHIASARSMARSWVAARYPDAEMVSSSTIARNMDIYHLDEVERRRVITITTWEIDD